MENFVSHLSSYSSSMKTEYYNKSVSCENSKDFSHNLPTARFLKVPKSFRARKASFNPIDPFSSILKLAADT